jgi:phosphatidylethanolamine/phosphatidyl-N-methylethanolamine N-methyltransferase
VQVLRADVLEETGTVIERAETGQPGSGISRPIAFFKGFLRHPSVVGSVVPSSGFLARRIAQPVRGAATVVELGPGTGAVTHALLQSMSPRGRLLAVELDEEFAAMLEADRNERLIVHRGDAAQLAHALLQHGLHPVDAVVSGIPFSTMDEAAGRNVLQQVWSSLRPGGVFVSYQIRGDVARLARDLMGRPRTGIELRNVPPIRIYSWCKPAA